MTVWLAGMEITADRLNDYSPDAQTSTGLTAASGFSVADFYALRSKGTVSIDITLTRTGSEIDGSTGNIANTDCCTLPSGWRPDVIGLTIGFWGDGVASGDFSIDTTGICQMRSSNGQNISNGSTIRLTATFNLGNVA
ncbi:hypothetical protein ABT348_24100 [Streptomyces olivaceus]|uniref:hypothetical protein n=1 Tax=Streptomyces olivaceus TaxID=47716 RepID=UPI00331C12DF